jgi:hypothetical protein
MTLFEIAAILVTASALGSFVNYKWIKLPSSIGLVLLAMTVGLLGILFKKIGLMSVYQILILKKLFFMECCLFFYFRVDYK